MSEVKLYSYFRSSAAYRVRIALHLKKIDFEYVPVHLLNDGGEQLKPAFKALNPLGEVPCLIHKGQVFAQSMAIIQYLDEVWPSPPLFPTDPASKAQVIQLCEIINSGIHPVQNLKVLNELEARFYLDPKGKIQWALHWIEQGFIGFEKILERTSGSFCWGGQLTAADLYLIPQIYNAKRFKLDLTPYPNIRRVENSCLGLAAFQKADPALQPDAP